MILRVIALVASYIPAKRAMRVDTMLPLHDEYTFLPSNSLILISLQELSNASRIMPEPRVILKLSAAPVSGLQTARPSLRDLSVRQELGLEAKVKNQVRVV